MSDSTYRLLILPHIRVHNANALSSPYTIGFPAMTAWLGAVHALQRLLRQQGFSKVVFNSVAVVSHQCDLQTYKGQNDFVSSIVATGNPLEPKADKNKPDGNAVRPSFIEEPRCHLDVSLIIEYRGIEEEGDKLAAQQAIEQLLLAKMKIASGDILSVNPPFFTNLIDEDQWLKVVRSLMPGYVLCSRQALVTKAMQQGQDALTALLDYLAVEHKSYYINNDDETTTDLPDIPVEKNQSRRIVWQSQRKTAGWLIPIAVGFQGLTSPGQANNQRDPNTPHCFAESVVTLGEFKMLHRISFNNFNSCLWRYQNYPDKQLYLCQASSYDENEPADLEATFTTILFEED